MPFPRPAGLATGCTSRNVGPGTDRIEVASRYLAAFASAGCSYAFAGCKIAVGAQIAVGAPFAVGAPLAVDVGRAQATSYLARAGVNRSEGRGAHVDRSCVDEDPSGRDADMSCIGNGPFWLQQPVAVVACAVGVDEMLADAVETAATVMRPSEDLRTKKTHNVSYIM